MAWTDADNTSDVAQGNPDSSLNLITNPAAWFNRKRKKGVGTGPTGLDSDMPLSARSAPNLAPQPVTPESDSAAKSQSDKEISWISQPSSPSNSDSSSASARLDIGKPPRMFRFPETGSPQESVSDLNGELPNPTAGAGADGANNGTGVSDKRTRKNGSSGSVSSTKPVIQVSPESKPAPESDVAPGVDLSAGEPPLPTLPASHPADPQLARQGSGNWLVRAIQRITGQVGPTPKPGEMYTGPTTDEERARRFAGFQQILKGLGQAGMGLRAGGGDKAQQAEAMQYMEAQPKLEMERANLENEMQHRQLLDKEAEERIGVSRELGERRIGVSQQRANTADSVAQLNARNKGQVIQADGSTRRMTPDEIMSDPMLSQDQNLKVAAVQEKQAKTALDQAQRDALMNPNNPVLQLKKQQIEATLAAAQMRTASYMAARQVQATDSLTGAETIVSMADVNGQPGRYIPLPTGTTRTMQQMASSVKDMIPRVQSQVTQLAQELGPAVGRWNELWVNRAGMDDPKFAELDQNLHLLASAVSRTHFGGGAPLAYTQALEKNFSEAQSPQDLLARIGGADMWIEGYAHMSNRGGRESGGGGNANPFSNNSTKPTKKGGSGGSTGSTGLPNSSTKPTPKW